MDSGVHMENAWGNHHIRTNGRHHHIFDANACPYQVVAKRGWIRGGATTVSRGLDIAGMISWDCWEGVSLFAHWYQSGNSGRQKCEPWSRLASGVLRVVVVVVVAQWKGLKHPTKQSKNTEKEKDK